MKGPKLVPVLLISAMGACEQEPEPTLLENVAEYRAPAEARRNAGPQRAPRKGVTQQDSTILWMRSD